MKARFFLFGAIFGIVITAFVLLKRLLDMEEQLTITGAELATLQREKAARAESYAEARESTSQFNEDNPFPDDPDKKMRFAMRDAIYRARAKDELGENHIDYQEEDEEDDS